jgi:hypothetical protein
MSETTIRSNSSARRSYGPGSRGHSVLSTISRSATPTSFSNGRSPKSGSPRQRRNTGRSGRNNGWAMLSGANAVFP